MVVWTAANLAARTADRSVALMVAYWARSLAAWWAEKRVHCSAEPTAAQKAVKTAGLSDAWLVALTGRQWAEQTAGSSEQHWAAQRAD
jgi:hypothetical protein